MVHHDDSNVVDFMYNCDACDVINGIDECSVDNQLDDEAESKKYKMTVYAIILINLEKIICIKRIIINN
jgi:hypothetical protein